MLENEQIPESMRNEARWKAFHQAYDSAMRTWRRGPDVSRAVNWLYVVSREDASDRDREVERENRELGLKLGGEAQAEHEIAPLVWKAANEGRLRTLADEPTLLAAQGGDAAGAVGGAAAGAIGGAVGGAVGGAAAGAGGGAAGGAAVGGGSAPSPAPALSGDGGQKPPADDGTEVIFPEGAPVEPAKPAEEQKPPPRPESEFYWEYLL